MVKKSRFTFSMRTLLFAIVVAAILAAVLEPWANKDRRYFHNAIKINKMGGVPHVLDSNVIVSVKFNDPEIVERNRKVEDDDLEFLASVKTIVRINLSGTDVTDKGIAYLKDLRNLEELNLEGAAVTKVGI